MEIVPLLSKEFEEEAANTRKMLAIVPSEKFDWKPHEKSMSLRALSTHIAELPGWVHMSLTTSELDFAIGEYKPVQLASNKALMDLFEKSYQKGKSALQNAKEEDLLPQWTLRNGETIYNVYTKYEVIRHSLAQQIHHRAQLGVFLRLLNIPIPGTYGPSADEMNF